MSTFKAAYSNAHGPLTQTYKKHDHALNIIVTFTHTHTHTHTHTQTHTHTHTLTHTHLHTHAHTITNTHTITETQLHTHAHTPQSQTHNHMHKHTITSTHNLNHTHTQVPWPCHAPRACTPWVPPLLVCLPTTPRYALVLSAICVIAQLFKQGILVICILIVHIIYVLKTIQACFGRR